jgi:3-dehydroquinate synthase
LRPDSNADDAPAAGDTVVDVPAGTGDATYEVVIRNGAFAQLGELARRLSRAHRFAVIADDRVAALHGSGALAALRNVGDCDLFVFPAGEANKTRETWAVLTDALLQAGCGRDVCIVALGGGVTGDLAGFVAATYLRGVPLLQVPTTLLAMIDASVGGKTAVDVRAGKNLVGAFHAPRGVIIDPDLLATLPDVELRNGLAEAVKHGAIADAGYFAWIEAAGASLLERDPQDLQQLIRRSVEIKAAVVARDPLETGERATLNFGHTAAHAIERCTGYEVAHGQAVAMGMAIEAGLGERTGVTAAGTSARLRSVLSELGLPGRLPAGLDPRAVLAATATDKKVRNARVRWSLISRIGVAARSSQGEWTLSAPDEIVLESLAS